MRRPFTLAVVFLSLLGFSCMQAHESDTVLTIGTFNMEWLGDGDSLDIKKRSEEDYRNIAMVIEKSEADVLGIEEVENAAALQKVLRYLPGYSFRLGTHGRAQNVGILYKPSVKITHGFEYMRVATRGDRNRPGFVVECSKGDFSWTMMVVHLKSTSRADSTPELRVASYANRREQVAVVRAWFDSTSALSGRNVIVAGDFNDFAQRVQNPTLTELLADSSAILLTKDLRSCRVPSWFGIDHILANTTAATRYLAGSAFALPLERLFAKEQADAVSDHCPVLARFTIAH
ncbi:MAG: endonuclease/exonuclease/phosphatase family protein [Candidatus Kapaibacterium sp.]